MSERRWIVQAKNRNDIPDQNIRKGDVMWVDYQEGYFGWTLHAASAETFTDKGRAIRASVQAKGPWYYSPDPGSLKVLPIDYTPEVKASWMLVQEEVTTK